MYVIATVYSNCISDILVCKIEHDSVAKPFNENKQYLRKYNILDKH